MYLCIFVSPKRYQNLCFQKEKKQDSYLSKDFYILTLPREHYITWGIQGF